MDDIEKLFRVKVERWRGRSPRRLDDSDTDPSPFVGDDQSDDDLGLGILAS